jgi:hypothetical protein
MEEMASRYRRRCKHTEEVPASRKGVVLQLKLNNKGTLRTLTQNLCLGHIRLWAAVSRAKSLRAA